MQKKRKKKMVSLITGNLASSQFVLIQIFYTDDSDNTDDVDDKTFHCFCSWAYSTLAAGISLA